MSNIKISASILSADFAQLGQEVKDVLAAGADEIHFDVMDNHYVPNLTMGPVGCKALRKFGITAPIDVHLMVKPVDSLINSFAEAGATTITFHPEASEHIDRSLQLIHKAGCKAGIAFNPATPLTCLEYIWDKLDSILLMSVNPGFGGQEFIASTLIKLMEAKTLIKQQKRKITLAVDGGVKINNIGEIAKAGADYFVIGSTIFESPKPYSDIITKLRKAIINY